MPRTWGEFVQNRPDDALRMERIDPELVALLKGTASAGARAAAISGDMSPIPPDPQAVAEQSKAERVQELISSSPFGDKSGKPVNLTAALELAALDEGAFAKLEEQSKGEPISFEDQRHQQLQQQAAEAQDRIRSLQHGQTLAAVQNPRRRFS